MSFEYKVDEVTGGEQKKVLGVVCLGVDRNGQHTLSHASGKTSLTADAQDIDKNSILTLASCTKLLTSIAALRLVQAGKLTLDDAVLIENHLPELCALEVFTSAPGAPLATARRTKPITLRTLLTHASGSGYDVLSPQLQGWRRSRGEECCAFTAGLPDAVLTPGLFEPGEGWAYGGGLDWVGLLVERVSGVGLGKFMRREVFDVVGCDERAGFDRKLFEGEIVQIVTKYDGKLVPFPLPVVEQKSERGGGGVFMSSANFARVLADFISPSPKLLNPDMLDELFSPQLEEGSNPLEALRLASPVFMSMTGALTSGLNLEGINHALGGLLVVGDTPGLGKSSGVVQGR
ncbi:hypothetical protein N0V90_000484 [Kalmusia sp. IMI 367209]|nr:hypothetical protein N0V90_000484 [Kalmusia sp. IMI 367209]